MGEQNLNEKERVKAPVGKEKGRGVFHSIRQAMIIVDPEYSIIECNNAAIQLLGYTQDLLKSLRIHDLLVKSDDHVELPLWSSPEVSYLFEEDVEIRLFDASVISVELMFTKSAYYQQDAWVVNLRDKDKTKLLKSELQRERRYFERLFHSIPFGTIVLDSEDRITDSNDAFCRMFGFSRQELLGRFVNDMIVPSGAKSEGLTLTNAVAEGKQIELETKRMRSDGSLIDVLITGYPFELPNGDKRVFGIYQDISDRVATRQALEDEKTYFESLFMHVPFAVAIINEQERIVDCNDIFTQLFGYNKTEVIESGSIQLIIPDQLKQEGYWLRSKVLSGENVQHETIRRHKNGELIQVGITSKRIIKSDGSMLILGIYQDIRQRKTAEKELKERERELQSMISFLPGMVYRCLLDDDYTMLFVSQGSVRVTGYPPLDFVSGTVSFEKLIVPEARQHIRQSWADALQHRKVFDEIYQITDSEGKLRWVWERGRPILDENGKVQFLEGYIDDITNQHILKEEFRRESDLLQSLMDNIPDTIYFKDLECRFVRINHAQAKMLGLNDPKEAIGKQDADFFDLQHSEIAKQDELHLMQTGIAVENKEERIKTALGWRWFTATKVPLRDSGGRIVGLAGVSRDITAFKEMENTFRESESELKRINAEKDKLFSVIAHDLRSPFNSFLLIAEMFVEEEYGLSEAEKNDLARTLYKTAYNVSDLLENLLEWSRLQRNMAQAHLKKLHVNSVIEQNLEHFSVSLSNKELELIKDFSQNDLALADENMLGSVLRNLISNAIKFTARGGTITIRTFELENGNTAIEISDTGIGIPESLMQKLFTVETKGRKGTEEEPSSGLGLILVKEFIDKMNGKLSVSSLVGKGTSFMIELPVLEKEYRN